MWYQMIRKKERERENVYVYSNEFSIAEIIINISKQFKSNYTITSLLDVYRVSHTKRSSGIHILAFIPK